MRSPNILADTMGSVDPEARVLIMGDGPMHRRARLALEAARFGVTTAIRKEDGILLATRGGADVVLCDMEGGEVDGRSLLEALLSEETIDTPPVFIFITGPGDPKSARLAIHLGADDCLTTPLDLEDLVRTVHAHAVRRKLLHSRLWQSSNASHRQTSLPLAAAAPHDSAELPESTTLDMTGRMHFATVLFCDVRNFTTIAERLMAGETAQLLNMWFERLGLSILEQHGRMVKFLGDGVMVVFQPDTSEPAGYHAVRGLTAGISISNAAREFAAWVKRHYADRLLPAFSVGVGIHTGELISCRFGGHSASDETVIGDAVNIAARLEEYTKALKWNVVASRTTVDIAGCQVRTGESRLLNIRGRQEPVEATEVLGTERIERDESPVSLDTGLRATLTANAREAALETKKLIGCEIRALSGDETTGSTWMREYRVIRRIGAGSCANVYLAERMTDSMEVALKVLRGGIPGDSELERRFVREATILARMQHPNVVRVHSYGVGEECCYIEMEFLPGGTLGRTMKSGVTPRQALALVAQMLQGIREVHGRGIVLRGLNPECFLLREDHTLALAEFGIVKLLATDNALTMKMGGSGSLDYVSPEILRGASAGHRSDFYSVGVVLYEMLTGRKPHRRQSLGMMHDDDKSAPPHLPPALSEVQSVIDGLMAYNPADRFSDANAALEAIDGAWTRGALSGWQFAELG
jgi:serine/threonine-protein kinase PpkA